MCYVLLCTIYRSTRDNCLCIWNIRVKSWTTWILLLQNNKSSYCSLIIHTNNIKRIGCSAFAIKCAWHSNHLWIASLAIGLRTYAIVNEAQSLEQLSFFYGMLLYELRNAELKATPSPRFHSIWFNKLRSPTLLRDCRTGTCWTERLCHLWRNRICWINLFGRRQTEVMSGERKIKWIFFFYKLNFYCVLINI